MCSSAARVLPIGRAAISTVERMVTSLRPVVTGRIVRRAKHVVAGRTIKRGGPGCAPVGPPRDNKEPSAPSRTRMGGARRGREDDAGVIVSARSSSADTEIMPGRAGVDGASQGSSPLSPSRKKACVERPSSSVPLPQRIRKPCPQIVASQVTPDSGVIAEAEMEVVEGGGDGVSPSPYGHCYFRGGARRDPAGTPYRARRQGGAGPLLP